MSVLAELQRLSSAEEFFECLGVPYEPQVLSVNRLHILRLVGNWLQDASPDEAEPDEVIRERFASQLAAAYEQLKESGPLSQRLFKVHKDAVKPKKEAPSVFVPLSILAAPKGGA